MAEVINLRQARKRAARCARAKRSALNRLTHGRAKAEEARSEALAAKAEHNLDLHQIERRDGQ